MTAAAVRVLVVEDEALIAMEIEDVLTGLGCTVVGPTGRLDEALRLAGEERLDAALLDVTIRGGKVFPVAERLLSLGVPFILASGYGDWAFPATLQNRPRLDKPFTRAALEEQLRLLCPNLTR